MTWHDDSGRTLDDYPHPSLAVDVALLTVHDGRLCVLLHPRPDDTIALPGTFVHVDETLHRAALRALRDKAGVTGLDPEQLKVFDDPTRDDRGRVLSVAHVDLVPFGRISTADLAPVDAHGRPAFDHDEIVVHAVRWARELYASAPDPRGLAGDTFTLLELQRVHEAVDGRALQKDTFRRRVIDHLVETGELARGGTGKPARRYRISVPPEAPPRPAGR